MNKVYQHWEDFPEQLWRWPNFSPEEIASNRFIKGKSGPVEKAELMIDARSMDMLQALRERLGKPLVLNSAFRTQTYNRQIKGAANSFHTKAMAFDVSMLNHDPEAFEAAAIAVGFRGIGHYPASNFMHIDTRQSAQVVRFKGPGKNNAWFPKSAGGFSASEPKPARLTDVVAKAEVLLPVAGMAVGTVAPLAEGDGPVQIGLGIALVVIVLAFVAIVAVKLLRRPVDV
jgi:zinc D-Ala-D-Ala carboxypeptidase